jgi:outer membrane protein assembly factor BamE
MLSSRLSLALAFSGSVLVACANPFTVGAYKIDVQQGNVLTQEMAAQLRPGQTRDQVRFILGTPLLTDIFHQERWDYVYSYRNGKTGVVESRQFSVYFDRSGRLERATGDVEAAGPDDLVAPTTRNRVVDLGSLPEGSDVPLPAPEGAGFFRGLLNSVGF